MYGNYFRDISCHAVILTANKKLMQEFQITGSKMNLKALHVLSECDILLTKGQQRCGLQSL